MRRVPGCLMLILLLATAACQNDGEADGGETALTTAASADTTGTTPAQGSTAPDEEAGASAPTGTEAPGTTAAATSAPAPAELVLTSSAFDDGGIIPIESTCDGANVSPALTWSGVPPGTGSLVLVVNDPDAGGWVHWAAWNIPPTAAGLAEDVPAGPELPDGTRQAANDFASGSAPGDLFPGGAPIKVTGYDGPCPPGAHRYVFTLFALSGTIDLPGGAPADQVGAAIAEATLNGSVLDQAAVTGEYSR